MSRRARFHPTTFIMQHSTHASTSRLAQNLPCAYLRRAHDTLYIVISQHMLTSYLGIRGKSTPSEKKRAPSALDRLKLPKPLNAGLESSDPHSTYLLPRWATYPQWWSPDHYWRSHIPVTGSSLDYNHVWTWTLQGPYEDIQYLQGKTYSLTNHARSKIWDLHRFLTHWHHTLTPALQQARICLPP